MEFKTYCESCANVESYENSTRCAIGKVTTNIDGKMCTSGFCASKSKTGRKRNTKFVIIISDLNKESDKLIKTTAESVSNIPNDIVDEIIVCTNKSKKYSEWAVLFGEAGYNGRLTIDTMLIDHLVFENTIDYEVPRIRSFWFIAIDAGQAISSQLVQQLQSEIDEHKSEYAFVDINYPSVFVGHKFAYTQLFGCVNKHILDKVRDTVLVRTCV